MEPNVDYMLEYNKFLTSESFIVLTGVWSGHITWSFEYVTTHSGKEKWEKKELT